MRKTVLFFFIICTFKLSAQMSVTGQTVGKGSGVAMVSVNRFLGSDGVNTLIPWVGVELGLTKRFDLCLQYGDYSFLGRHRTFSAVGGVLSLPTKKLGFDSSLYQLVIIPMHHRFETSSVLANSALAVSRDFSMKKLRFTPYAGIYLSYALGPKDRALSVPERLDQLALGLSVPVGKWTFMPEYDYGKSKSFGIMICRSFSFRRAR